MNIVAYILIIISVCLDVIGTYIILNTFNKGFNKLFQFNRLPQSGRLDDLTKSVSRLIGELNDNIRETSRDAEINYKRIKKCFYCLIIPAAALQLIACLIFIEISSQYTNNNSSNTSSSQYREK
jgi:hypothetical protein